MNEKKKKNKKRKKKFGIVVAQINGNDISCMSFFFIGMKIMK